MVKFMIPLEYCIIFTLKSSISFAILLMAFRSWYASNLLFVYNFSYRIKGLLLQSHVFAYLVSLWIYCFNRTLKPKEQKMLIFFTDSFDRMFVYASGLLRKCSQEKLARMSGLNTRSCGLAEAKFQRIK